MSQPMTLAQRVQAARQPSDYTDTITAALVKHARWVHDADQSLASKQLAFDVLQDTDKYTLRFARWYLLHPVADNVTDVSEISDQNVMDNIPTLWDFALPPEQP